MQGVFVAIFYFGVSNNKGHYEPFVRFGNYVLKLDKNQNKYLFL